MSYKFDSLITILNKLDRNEQVTIHSLMDNLEISERSVHRYLQTLQVAGFPIHFDKKCKPHILRKKWHQSQTEKVLKDGRLEVSFRVNGLVDIKSWIYRWIPNVEVVAPLELKNMIRNELKQAVKRFE